MANIKHDLVDLTFARMQNYAEMQFGVIVNLTKWYFLSITIKYCIFFAPFYYSSGRYVCFYICKISLLTVKVLFYMYIDLSLIHIWWMLIFLFPQDLIFKIKTIAVLATSWCRIWIWNFSLPPLVKHPLYGFFFIS